MEKPPDAFIFHAAMRSKGRLRDCASASSEAPQKERFHRHCARTAFVNTEESCRPLMSRERDFYEFLESAESVARRIRTQADGGLLAGVSFGLERTFLDLALRFDSIAAFSYDHHRVKPDVAVLLEVLRSQAQSIRDFVYQDGDHFGCGRHVRACISLCHEMLCSPEAKKERKRFDQRQQENAASCRHYFDGLLRKSPRLFVSRVDLYAPVTGNWWQLGDILAAEKAIDLLILRLRRGLVVESLLGWVIVRESGCCRGMHYSVLVAQGGYVPRDGYESAVTVGRDWVGSFGGAGVLAKASYFESYSQCKPEHFNELGHIDIDDQLARSALNAAIDGAWDVPIVFDAAKIKDNTYKNPDGTLKGIHKRNLRKGILPSS